MPQSRRRPRQDPAADAAVMLRSILGPVERGEVQSGQCQGCSPPEAATGALATLETLTGRSGQPES
jgi:hypothetical protein